MARMKDMVGQRFGRLVAVEPVGKARNGGVLWKCKCDCGNFCTVAQGNLSEKNYGTKSCGCLRRESMKQAQKKTVTHGQSRTRLYNIWHGAIDRCEREGAIGYKNYGARGISFYPPWKENFDEFKKWALSNGYQDGLEIDRIDNSKGYSPDNCRWVTRSENNSNKRTNVIRTCNGVTDTLTNLCKMFGKRYGTVRQRVSNGMSIEEALEKPCGYRKKRTTELSAFGVTRPLREWCELYEIRPHLVCQRISSGWPVEKALTTPLRKRKDNK